MALIKMGALAQDVRGSLNGTTFSRNRGGAYVRSKVSPIQPGTPAQSGARAFFKTIAQIWATGLSETQRQGWITYAQTHPYTNVFGDTIILSGIAMFQAINRAGLQIANTIQLDAPTVAPPPDLGGIAPTCTTLLGVPTFTFVPINAPISPVGYYVFATRPIPAGQQPHRTDYRLVNTPETGVFADPPATFGAKYLARFSLTTIPVPSRIALRIRPIDGDTSLQAGPYGAVITSSGT